MSGPFAFDTSYAGLPERFYARQAPARVSAPRVLRVNRALAETLGVDPARLAGEEGAAMLAGNALPEGATPMALAYAGHQFGNFVPQLGDGRALLLGEVVGRDGLRRDIQLKGSGPTPFSRRGDGRAALGPVLREYLVSEAMHAMGIPATRALAAVATGEEVYRETPLPGAVLTRVAASHLRVGTFQYFAARRDAEALRKLADYTIGRHYPELRGAERPALALFEAVMGRQARLIAGWMGVGFIHGVMNTDNMTLSGETIDFGPCAFMDAFHPATVFSSIDQQGRYAYANQPGIAQWNLARLAEAMLTLFDDDVDRGVALANESLAKFAGLFGDAWGATLRAKLGLAGSEEGDRALADGLLDTMQVGHADFTLTFRRLSEAAAEPARLADVRPLFADPMTFDDWAARWSARLARESVTPAARASAMRRVNPWIVPRNHRVEEALAAAQTGDMAPFDRLFEAVTHPWDDQPANADLAAPPAVVDREYRTFCGT
ncbi:MAG: YdiU family protein [Alphaproteobacteria bacterium]|nr:YdiU family protein [Alphaproteobacteria bacterium]